MVCTVAQIIISALTHRRVIAFQVCEVPNTLLETLRVACRQLPVNAWSELGSHSIALLLDSLHRNLALQKVIVTSHYLRLVECLVFVHFRFHKVLHDAGVEVSALFFTRGVDLLGIVHKVFGTGLFKWLVPT